MIEVGLVGEAVVTVAKGNTAIEVGSGSVPVFATPMMVALMENAAINALAGHLEDGQTTVGMKVDVTHISATPIGMSVTARATLVEMDGRLLRFRVTAVDDAGPVGEGFHDRFVVDQAKFMAKVQQKSG